MAKAGKTITGTISKGNQASIGSKTITTATGNSVQVVAPVKPITIDANISLKPRALDDYKVVLGVDQHIQMPGPPAEMKVWIGPSDIEAVMPARMVQDEKPLSGEGESARVEPSAPEFEVLPVDPDTQCIRIHPSGSEVRFWLKPKDSGNFYVSADVYLYATADCSGSPIPKTAESLQVVVEVNEKKIVELGAKELGAILWQKLLDFWGALVVLFFGLVLFLIRGKLKQWFGYDGK